MVKFRYIMSISSSMFNISVHVSNIKARFSFSNTYFSTRSRVESNISPYAVVRQLYCFRRTRCHKCGASVKHWVVCWRLYRHSLYSTSLLLRISIAAYLSACNVSLGFKAFPEFFGKILRLPLSHVLPMIDLVPLVDSSR